MQRIARGALHDLQQVGLRVERDDLTDVAMPVLDGIEATRLLKARDATRSARVVAYTANTSIGSPLAETLFDAVLQKPSPPDVVLATVRHVASF